MNRKWKDKISDDVDAALTSLAEQRGEGYVVEIKMVLDANLERGRIERFLGDDYELSRVDEYIQRVVGFYDALNPKLHGLQIEKDTASWETLGENLQTWAYNYFRRKNFTHGPKTMEIVGECASDAAGIIVNAYFPFDTDFTPWAHRILLNVCGKYIRSALKKSVIPNDVIVPIDDVMGILPDMSMQDNQRRNEIREELEEAIEKLSPSRKDVILKRYFEGLSLHEIAAVMERSIGAVYSLHFYALQDLQKIIKDNRYNNE